MGNGKAGVWWRAMKAQLPIVALLLFVIALCSVVPLVVILLGAYLLHSWPAAYGVLTAHTAPNDPSVRVHAIGYFLSIVGWLVVPAIVGAIAGSIAGGAVQRSKGHPLMESARKLKAELTAAKLKKASRTDVTAPGASGGTVADRTDGDGA